MKKFITVIFILLSLFVYSQTNKSFYKITLTAGGGTTNLPVTNTYKNFYITNTGTITLTSNWTIQSSGTPAEGEEYNFIFAGSVIPSGNSLTIFGTDILADVGAAVTFSNRLHYTAYYNGSSWEVRRHDNLTQDDVVFNRHMNDDAVNTNELVDNAVTIAKFQSMGAGYLLYGDASGDPALLDMHNAGNILRGDGTTVSALDASTAGNLVMGTGATVNSINPSGDVDIDGTGVFSISAGAIVNADVNAAAAIAYSKLEAMTSANILVGSAGNVATVVDPAGDVEISNAGATTIEASAVVEDDLGSATAGGITVGAVAARHIISANLKPLLDGTTNNLFPVNAGDVVLYMVFWTQTAAGLVVTVDAGPDATARAAGADTDGILLNADGNAAAVYSTEDGTYDGVLQAFGAFIVDANGYITITSSVDISATGFVGGCTMFYIAY